MLTWPPLKTCSPRSFSLSHHLCHLQNQGLINNAPLPSQTHSLSLSLTQSYSFQHKNTKIPETPFLVLNCCSLIPWLALALCWFFSQSSLLPCVHVQKEESFILVQPSTAWRLTRLLLQVAVCFWVHFPREMFQLLHQARKVTLWRLMRSSLLVTSLNDFSSDLFLALVLAIEYSYFCINFFVPLSDQNTI